jgi:hypothetical protein
MRGPATRALASIGITTLGEVAGRSRKELAALHGMGPKASGGPPQGPLGGYGVFVSVMSTEARSERLDAPQARRGHRRFC